MGIDTRIVAGGILALAAATAGAQEFDNRWFVAGQGGFTVTDDEEYDTGGGLTISVGRGLYPGFAVAGFFQTGQVDVTVGNNNQKTEYTRNGLGISAFYTALTLGRTDLNLIGAAALRRIEFLGVEQDGFSTQFGIGLATSITANLEFVADARYQVDYVDEEPPISDTDYYTTNIEFGLRYKFGVWPPPPPDGDFDGVPDATDRCPNTPAGAEVDTQGCAIDSDGDGVPDFRDRCPNTEAGMMVADDGCPLDSDGDGVPDINDICPDTPAGVTVNAEGCARDSDGDGVPDVRDLCPGTAYGAEVDTNGCPFDTDRDGVPDFADSCPNTPRGVAVDEVGCDRDGDRDGVVNADDLCPNTPPGTPVGPTGCANDQDGDGVPDHLDRCPNTPAGTPVDVNGCALDHDGDGVPDHLDRCPNTPLGQPVNEEGCSRDTDADGVVNAADLCPNTMQGLEVDPSGCPIIDQTLVLDDVHFEFDRSDLLPDSKTLLRKLVKSLKDQPNLRIEVAGHTDSLGSDAYNKTLSQARADAVKAFLVANGIPAGNVTAVGYGEERPVTENETEAGRAENRRVEIQLLDFEG